MDRRRKAPSILTAYYRPKPGGLCKRYFRAIRALLDRGHIVHYVSVEPFPIEHDCCHWHRLWWPTGWAPEGPLFWIWLHAALPWIACVIGLRENVRYAFSFSINYGALFLPLRLIRKIQYSLFLRADTRLNHQFKGIPSYIHVLDSSIEAAAIWRARVFSVSDALGEAVRSRHRIAQAVSWSTLRNDAPHSVSRARPSTGGPFRIAYVGVLEHRKRPDFLIRLLSTLDTPDIQIHFFGTGPLERELRSLAADYQMAERVQFHGWVASEQIWPQIHLLLHPSMHEGAPNAVLEALAAGCPVIASDIAEHREILPPPMLAPADDPDTWRDRIASVFSDFSAAQALADQAAAELTFDWNQRAAEAITGSMAPVPRPSTSTHE